MPRLILALDQEPTSSRAILFHADGKPVASAQKEFPPIYPLSSGAVERSTELAQ